MLKCYNATESPKLLPTLKMINTMLLQIFQQSRYFQSYFSNPKLYSLKHGSHYGPSMRYACAHGVLSSSVNDLIFFLKIVIHERSEVL